MAMAMGDALLARPWPGVECRVAPLVDHVLEGVWGDSGNDGKVAGNKTQLGRAGQA